MSYISEYLTNPRATATHAARVARFVVQNAFLMAQVRWLKQRAEVAGRVTIVTPTYNRPERLKEAIQSVLSQSYPNWEQIIVSDGPDSRIPAMLAELCDPRLRSYHTLRFPVMGNYQRNSALKHATGEFVLFLDDDNVIFPDCLNLMVSGFTSTDIGYVVCPIHYGDGVMAPTQSFQHGQIDLLNFMIRRRLVERVGGQNVRYAADYYLIDRIRQISRGVFLDEFVGHHR